MFLSTRIFTQSNYVLLTIVLCVGMKELHDNPKRTSSKEPFGKKQLRKDQGIEHGIDTCIIFNKINFNDLLYFLFQKIIINIII